MALTEERNVDRETKKARPRDDRGRDWSNTGPSQRMPRIHHQKLERVKAGFLEQSEGGRALPTVRFQTSSLQKCEIIKFYCLSHPVCGPLL